MLRQRRLKRRTKKEQQKRLRFFHQLCRGSEGKEVSRDIIITLTFLLRQALNKKIKAIEELQNKQTEGAELDDKQLAKIASLEETLEALQDFIEGRRT